MSDLNRLVDAVIEAKTDDFAELCKIAGIDMRTELAGADLSGTDLRYTDLRYADLRHTNLSRADLRYADLSYANLEDADLRSANLEHSVLIDTKLSRAQIDGAQMAGAARDVEEPDQGRQASAARGGVPEELSQSKWAEIVVASMHDHSSRLRNWIAVRARNPDDAADIHQELFVQLLKMTPVRGYVAAAALPAAFVLKIASTVLFKRQRTDRRMVLETPPDFESESEAHADPVLILESEEVLRAIERLPQAQRKVWELRFEKKLSPLEIAKAMGIDEETVNKHLRKVLKRIRRLARGSEGKTTKP